MSKSFDCLFYMRSFAMLRGPWAHFQYLVARERIAFTGAFFGALLGTIYFAIKVSSSLRPCRYAVFDALLWYLLASAFYFGSSSHVFSLMPLCLV